MKCPTCAQEGKRSIVTEGSSIVAAVYIPQQFDEDGNPHPRRAPPSTTDYSCSNGHRWTLGVDPAAAKEPERIASLPVGSCGDVLYASGWVPGDVDEKAEAAADKAARDARDDVLRAWEQKKPSCVIIDGVLQRLIPGTSICYGAHLKTRVLPVYHRALQREGDSEYRSRCPMCDHGMMLVHRNHEFKPQRRDHCIACMQRYWYLDDDMNGEAFDVDATGRDPGNAETPHPLDGSFRWADST